MGGDYHINSCWRALQRDRTSHTKTLGKVTVGKVKRKKKKDELEKTSRDWLILSLIGQS